MSTAEKFIAEFQVSPIIIIINLPIGFKRRVIEAEDD
jgi:hypothetical protein